MEQQTLSSNNSKWTLAARDGLILAAVTVVISTLTFLTENKATQQECMEILSGRYLMTIHREKGR